MVKKSLMLTLYSILASYQAYGMDARSSHQESSSALEQHALEDAQKELENNHDALHEACARDDFEHVKLLIATGASVTKFNHNPMSQTPLHCAVMKKTTNTAIIDYLMQHGASDTLTMLDGASGQTPLYYAAVWENTQAMECLIKHGASFDTENCYGCEPLRDFASRTFFFPCQKTPAEYALAPLKEQCLVARFRNYQKASLPTFILQEIASLGLWAYDFIADRFSIGLQRKFIQAWTHNHAVEHIQRLVRAHCRRHFNKVKAMLMLQQQGQETAHAHSCGEKNAEATALLKHIVEAQEFFDLDQSLQQSITSTIHDTLYHTGKNDS